MGRKVRGVRELRGKKQETMADELGISQQAVSKLEQSEHIEDETLEKIAGVLGVSIEAIKNFNEEAVFNQLHNTLHDQSSLVNYQCTFNPMDKLMEAIEENKKLYERWLKDKDETIAKLEKMLEGK